jgi:hypothetical protein
VSEHESTAGRPTLQIVAKSSLVTYTALWALCMNNATLPMHAALAMSAPSDALRNYALRTLV